MSYVVVYDACVLYPAPLRDFLMHLALTELFQARWSDAIHDEWIRNVLADRPNLRSRLQRTRTLMDKAVPDSLVTGYEPLNEKLDLPDPDDRHVLAAAIRCGAQAIVTSCQQCIRTMTTYVRRNKVPLQVMDITQLIQRALKRR